MRVPACALATSMTALVLAHACSPFEADGPPSSTADASPTSSEASTNASDTVDGGSVAARCADALDRVGCPCTEAGASRACFAGTPGPSSACTAGLQFCTPDTWSSCSGAGHPTPEVCFNGRDDDCNGVVDNGCLCSGTVDLCSAGSSLTPFLLVEPNPVRVGEEVQIILVSRTPGAPESVQAKSENSEQLCLPGTPIACAVGPGCQGWYATRISLVAGTGPLTASGRYDLTPNTGLICSGGTTGQALTLNITP